MRGQYYGFEKKPIPEHPTKEEALIALSMLTGNLRYEYIDYNYQIVKRYILSLEFVEEGDPLNANR
jgi:hypothetical protein